MWDQADVGKLQLSSTFDMPAAPGSSAAGAVTSQAIAVQPPGSALEGTIFWYTSVNPSLLSTGSSTVDVQDSLKSTAAAGANQGQPVKSAHLPFVGGSHAIYAVSSVRNDESPLRSGPNPFAMMPMPPAVEWGNQMLLPRSTEPDPAAAELLRWGYPPLKRSEDAYPGSGNETATQSSSSSSAVADFLDVQMQQQEGNACWVFQEQQKEAIRRPFTTAPAVQRRPAVPQPDALQTGACLASALAHHSKL